MADGVTAARYQGTAAFGRSADTRRRTGEQAPILRSRPFVRYLYYSCNLTGIYQAIFVNS